MTAPSAHAAAASSPLSSRSCWIRRRRPAPMERRSAISRSRAAARASNRLATFEQASSSTSDTMAAITHSGRSNSSRRNDGPCAAERATSGWLMYRARSSAGASAGNVAARSRRNCVMTGCRRCWTSSAVTPGASRPHVRNQCWPGLVSASGRLVVAGIQTSVSTPGSTPVKPSRATPTICVLELAFEREDPAEHRRVAAETTFPECVAEHCDPCRRLATIVGRREHAAVRGHDAKRREEIT